MSDSVLNRLTRKIRGPEDAQAALADPYSTGAYDLSDTYDDPEGGMNGEKTQTQGDERLPYDALVERLDRLEKQNSDKDREIGRLRGEVESTNKMFERFPHLAGTAPEQDSDPGQIDEDTLNMFQAKFEKDPAGAMVDIMEYNRNLYEDRLERLQNDLTQKDNTRSAQEKQRQVLQQVESHIWSQLDAASQDFGPEAEDLMLDLRENKENSVLGQAIQQDPYMALTQTGVYDYVSKNVSTPSGTQGGRSPGVRGVARPQARRRDISANSGNEQISEEDKIKRSIMGATKPTSRGAPSARRRFLGSEV